MSRLRRSINFGFLFYYNNFIPSGFIRKCLPFIKQNLEEVILLSPGCQPRVIAHQQKGLNSEGVTYPSPGCEPGVRKNPTSNIKEDLSAPLCVGPPQAGAT